jgi:chromosome segregation ATPase
MKSLRNNRVVGIILSLMLSSTAFASPLTDQTKGHLKEAINLIDSFNKSAEDGDALLARIQDQIDGKNGMVYQELRSKSDELTQRFKDNSTTLEKLRALKNSDCALALADTSKSVESEKAIDACYELTDALAAATDARGSTAEGLDAINDAMSKYVTVLEALDAAAVQAQEEKDAAAAKAATAAAKAAAAKAAAAKAAAFKKTTITCVKGKLTKKVTAVKPVCPTGYKVKK